MSPLGLERLLFVVAILLMSLSGLGVAQDLADSDDISITIHPSGSELVGETEGGHTLPGTVSARLAVRAEVPPGNDLSGELSTVLVVGDDRGTGQGWGVIMSAEVTPQELTVPSMIQNDSATILRLMPPYRSAESGDIGVVGGRSLGSLNLPISVLVAPQGNGAGVFQQQLVLTHPPSGAAEPGTPVVLIELPSAP
jgi:hypothetical protein